MTGTVSWQLVVPVKGGRLAKSRLHPPSGVAREELARALAADCLAACCAGMPPERVFVVTSDADVAALATALGARVVPDPGRGLDAAAVAGRDAAAAQDPDAAVGVLLGDLPALRQEDLMAALDAAAAYPLAIVPDADGTGTVLLTSLSAPRLAPAFGAGSAARHEAGGHTRLDLPLARLRTDVDDDRGLAAAQALGVGPSTAAVLRSGTATLPRMQASVHTFDETSGAGSVLLDDGREVAFSADTFAGSALRHLRPGQRLSIELGSDGLVSRLWIVGIGEGQRIG
ncbi:MAG TPA: 2-phospho-L-lactate guanylyltransferase [Pedococcus sp.]|nr:2-phospho-L-lactate guanylyltransferase [Pedococcus sp.]